MKLKKLKLNALSEAGLKDKEMNTLKGGQLLQMFLLLRRKAWRCCME